MSLKRPYYQDIQNCRLPGSFAPQLSESGLNYKAKDDDIFLSTFPKCGTTWTQIILVHILSKGKRVIHKYSDLNTYSPFLEMCGSKQVETNMPKNGVIKIHLAYDLTPQNPNAKYIYVARNPRDTCVSLFHHTRTPIYNFADGTFDEYFEIFINGQNDWGDYFDHLLSWWEHRHDPNVLIVTYEEMKADIRDVIKRFAKFLGPEYQKSVEDEEVMKEILEVSSIDFMRKAINPGMESLFQLELPKSDGAPQWMKELIEHMDNMIKELNPVRGTEKFSFVRKGQVGDWKNYFNEDQIRRLNQRFTERLSGHDVGDLLAIWKKHGCID